MSDAQSALAMLMRKKMAFFAIQSAEMVTMVSAQSAGNVAQVVSAMTESSARSPIFSRGARAARLTGALRAPRKHMDAELEP